jgi:hypothetical protein
MHGAERAEAAAAAATAPATAQQALRQAQHYTASAGAIGCSAHSEAGQRQHVRRQRRCTATLRCCLSSSAPTGRLCSRRLLQRLRQQLQLL